MADVKRVQVQRYEKSGKLAAIYGLGRYEGYVVIELTPDMAGIVDIRNPKYIKSDAFSATRYEAEIVQTIANGQIRCRLVRVLAPEDTKIERWTSTRSLADLPVSPEEHIFTEERAWAGAREGEFGGRLFFAGVAAFAAYFSVTGFVQADGGPVSAIVALVAAVISARLPWKLPKKPEPVKLAELSAYKAALRERSRAKNEAAKTEFENRLRDYSVWERLSPQDFELAVSIRLEKEGYDVQATQYSKDGGVDIEAVGNQKQPVIVQVKQYKNNVGVAVVREMIGVRTNRNDNPQTMIFSLVGFTRGARELAEAENIELRDIKSELLKV